MTDRRPHTLGRMDEEPSIRFVRNDEISWFPDKICPFFKFPGKAVERLFSDSFQLANFSTIPNEFIIRESNYDSTYRLAKQIRPSLPANKALTNIALSK